MKVAIAGHGYASAVEAFVRGNLSAAAATRTLTGRLDGYAAMAGDDATSSAFAAAYDEAATEAVATLADLVGSLDGLARLAEASVGNHSRADEASTLPAWAQQLTGPPTLADHTVTLLPITPPSAVGGDPPLLPGPVAWLLDQIQGIVWPDADTDRLRQAASSWHDAAASTGLITSYVDAAADSLETENSPEIPLATAATRELRSAIDRLVGQLDALGDACSIYADQVDAQRDQMIALLEQLVEELAIGTIIAGTLSVLSAGLAAPAAGAVGSARLAWAAAELKAIIDTLCTLAGGTATGVRTITVTIRDTRTFLGRYLRVAEARADQRGVLDPSAFLGRHEHSGSHTLALHVGKSDAQLAHRFVVEPNRKLSSSYIDQDTAERAIRKVIHDNRAHLDEWLASGRKRDTIRGDAGQVIGRVLRRGADDAVDTTRLRVAIVRDPRMPEGWRILTSFPDL